MPPPRRPCLRHRWLPQAAAEPDGHLHDLEDVGHHLRIGHLAIEDELGADLAGLHLGAGKRLVDSRFQLLRVERDADQERDGPVGLIPEGEAGGPEGLAEDVQEPAVELIAQNLHVGDGRVGDHHPGQGPPGLDDPGLPHDHGDLGLGLLDHLDQVGDVLGHLAVGAARRRAGWTAGNQSRRVAPELDHARLRRRRCLSRVRLGLDGNDPGYRLAPATGGGGTAPGPAPVAG